MTSPRRPDRPGQQKPELQKPELLVLYDAGEVWTEKRISFPDGLESGVFTFPSPGLRPRGWILSLLRLSGSIRQIGTLGAAWAVFEPEERVQLWIPGDLEIPEGVLVQVMFSEAT